MLALAGAATRHFLEGHFVSDALDCSSNFCRSTVSAVDFFPELKDGRAESCCSGAVICRRLFIRRLARLGTRRDAVCVDGNVCSRQALSAGIELFGLVALWLTRLHSG